MLFDGACIFFVYIRLSTKIPEDPERRNERLNL